MKVKHGDYEPGLGYYDRTRKGWVDRPDQLTRVNTAAHAASQAQRDEVAAWGHKPSAFKPNPTFEAMIRLRESDKPEDRANFQQIARGSNRIQLHDYEQAKASAQEASTDGD